MSGGQLASTERRFCAWCGSSTVPGQPFCPSCGKAVGGHVRQRRGLDNTAILAVLRLLVVASFLWGSIQLFPSPQVRGIFLVATLIVFIAAIARARALGWRLLLYAPLAFMVVLVFAAGLQTIIHRVRYPGGQ